MFGLLVGALFFSKPEFIILVGVGSALPDLDREYAFFSRKEFIEHQPHRALCHNYLFICLVYLVSPFLGLGAFLHTALDALTTVKDRGVEWLYPFSRFVKKAANDEHGNRLPNVVKNSVYFYQYDPIEITRKSDKDLKEQGPSPWRRTYGPALSGGLLDQGIFIGSFVLFVLWSVWSSITTGHIQGLNPASYQFSVMLPIIVGSIGIVLNMMGGELDRRKRGDDYQRPRYVYEVNFGVSLFLMFSAIFLGAYLNPAALGVYGTLAIPVVLGVIAAVGIGFILPRIYSKVGVFRVAHHREGKNDAVVKGKDDDPVIV